MTTELDWLPVRRKTGKVEARQAIPGESFQTLTGLQRVPAGAWILRDEDGNEWIVQAEHFEQFYEVE